MRRRGIGFAVMAAAAAFFLLASTSHAQIPAEIVDVEWEWRGTLFEDGTIVRPADSGNYTLRFGANESVSVRADCNIGGGDYTTAGDAMQIGPILTTLIACPPGSLDRLYLQQLEQVARFRMVGDELILVLGPGIGWMRFGQADTSGDAEIFGAWQWQGTLMSDDTAIVPSDPSDFTLELEADGRAVIRADCNTGNGPFMFAGNEIALGPFALTRALCPPGSLDTHFLRQLENVVSYLIVDGDLILDLPFSSGGMRFARVPQPPSDADFAEVTGTVTYRQFIALPADAVVTVRIEDASRADAPAILIGEQVITDHGGQVPVPFRILFDSTQVDPRVTYTLRARIEDRDGRLLWINTQAYPVITQGNPTHDIEIVVTPVG